jgi:hypothetical protein
MALVMAGSATGSYAALLVLLAGARSCRGGVSVASAIHGLMAPQAAGAASLARSLGG